MTDLAHVPLHDLHVGLGARFAPFAGYEMPLRYAEGAIAEHLWTRSSASLFDVSHMGVFEVSGAGAVDALETVVPSALRELAVGAGRYTFFPTGDGGGVLDDLIVTRLAPDRFQLVVNAGNKHVDRRHVLEHLGDRPDVEVGGFDDVGILALQGPLAADVLTSVAGPAPAGLAFGNQADHPVAGVTCRISRSGYTGEDGFELIVPVDGLADVAAALLADERVRPAGLGARDSLRLEAGFCLHGNDLSADINPIAAGLGWTVQRRRREEGGFAGADRLLAEIADGPARRRVGLAVGGRRPVRPGATLTDPSGDVVGEVTSGTFGPSVDAPIAMGYVDTDLATPGTELLAVERGRPEPVTVATLPFVAHRRS